MFAAALGVRAEDDATPAGPAAELNDAWWATARALGDGDSWEQCAARLEAALARAGDAPHAARCADLLASIRRAQANPGSPQELSDDHSVEAFIEALPEVRLSHVLLLRPLQTYGPDSELVWEILAQRQPVGSAASAGRILQRGREAIPALIVALDDLRATRSVLADRDNYEAPLVARVNDIALALIEAISLTRLHIDPADYHPRSTDSPLISEWPAQKRAAQIALVQAWWDATRDHSPGAAALLRLEQVERRQQVEMLDAMIGTGRMRPEALQFLLARYRNGWEIDLDMAQRTVRAGSRAPLEFLQEATRAGRPVEHDMISLIGEFGGIDDYKLLRDALVQPSDDSVEIDLGMVVNRLNYNNNPLAVPVLVAVIELGSSQFAIDKNAPRRGGAAPQSYLLRAAEHLELLTGRDFGFARVGSTNQAERGFDDILRWWQREGKGAFDYEQVRPYAPGGIR